MTMSQVLSISISRLLWPKVKPGIILISTHKVMCIRTALIFADALAMSEFHVFARYYNSNQAVSLDSLIEGL